MGYLKEKTMDKDTILYSLIGASALENGHGAKFNDCFSEMDINHKVIPLNIREDDIGFFLNGFKDSQIKAAYFEKEYWNVLPELLDDVSDEVKTCGIADVVTIIDGKNVAELVYGKAVTSIIKNKFDLKTVSISLCKHIPTTLSIIYHLEKLECPNLSLTKCDATILLDDEITIDGVKLEYDEILEEIAKIKTKQWSETYE